MSTEPDVAKAVWTEADFDAMSWHDNAIHAVAVEPVPDHPGRLLLDLDYIVGGILPEPPATRVSFWICPATLVFDEAWDLTADADLRGWSFQLFISDISRSGPDERGFSDWTVAGDRFSIELSFSDLSMVMVPTRAGCPFSWHCLISFTTASNFSRSVR